MCIRDQLLPKKIMSLLLLLYSYIVIAFLIFGYFLGVFLADQSTPNTHIASWVVLGLATLFWPIVLPLAYLERRVRKSTEVHDVRPEEPDLNCALSSPHHSASIKTASVDQDIRRSA